MPLSDSARPLAIARPSDGHSAEPLLEERGRGGSYEGYDVERARRRHEMRSRSPAAAKELATRKKYLLAAVFLVLSLVSFVVQTEATAYIQSHLGWRKPYLMLYFTHCSLSVLWPFQVLILKARKPHIPWAPFLKAHFHSVRTTAQMIMAGTPHLSPSQAKRDPTVFMLRRVVFITAALTVGGSTWYVAVNMTTPSDLTAIYNCSAFFAYVFSIFMLKERMRVDKISSVVVACVGVLIVAYGDSGTAEKGQEEAAANRTLGNLIIGVGSVMYGFYEVLYKKVACPPEGVSSSRTIVFANAVGTGLGLTTLVVLWIPIPFFHVMGWETFELPHGQAALLVAVSVFSNAVFSGSFLVLISLTSPVLSSVAALLTIFLVAVVDQMLPSGKPLSGAAIVGGLTICAAFFLLAWSMWREMAEDANAVARGKEDDEDWSESETERDEA